jgi:hypothetical protein
MRHKICKNCSHVREVSKLICGAGENSDAGQLEEASQILLDIASLEEAIKLFFENI